mgnify:CR=1 FL=1
MKLGHVVITAVARDDLTDGGANHFRETIKAVRRRNPSIVIEVLVPDFLDKDDSLQMVLDARPEIFNHNLETVRRLTPSVRSRAQYDRSLAVLCKAKDRCGDTSYTKSGLMLGLGETESERFEAMADLRLAKCDILTLGQYLQPDVQRYLPVARYLPPEEFAFLGQAAQKMGYQQLASGPFVRSSYHAREMADVFK